MTKIVVPGIPVGKGRPRFTKTGHAYTPDKTRDYEKLIVLCYKTQGGKKYTGAVFVGFEAFFPIPQAFGKRKKAQMDGMIHCKRPDTDNIVKAAMDALNGIAWDDDSCVMIDKAVKRYTAHQPRLELTFYDENANHSE